MEGATEANAVRQRVRGETFVLRKKRRLLMTVSLRRPGTIGGSGHKRLNAGRRGNRRLQSLRYVVDDVAVVRHRLATADPTLHQESALQPRVDADIKAIPVCELLTKLGCGFDHVSRSNDGVGIEDPSERLPGVWQASIR